MANSFYIADTHFGHKNIVRGTSSWEDKTGCRNFKTLEKHDSIIIDNINKKVKPNDTLYIVGDFAFGGKENIPKYRERILCRNVIMVRGNHDQHMFKNSVVFHKNKYINVNSLFKDILDLFEVTSGKTKVVVCHYPILSWHGKDKGSIHLYGHTHKELNYNPRAICLSAECIGYEPLSITEIHNIVKNRIKYLTNE